jgi:fatty acid desaturase
LNAAEARPYILPVDSGGSMAGEIPWYRTPIDRDKLRELTAQNDLRGLAHAGGFVLIYLLTTGVALYFFLRRLWVPMVIAAYVHSLFHGFVGMGAAVHELSHRTAFRTRWLNELFYRLFAFLTWNSHYHFRESHSRHHRHTGFMELDKEIKPEPMRLTTPLLIGWLFFDWANFWRLMRANVAHAFGNTDVDFFFWCPLLTKDNIKTKNLVRWARTLFVGHLLLAALFACFELWILIYTVSFGYFFASFLVHGCEVQQHNGLSRNVPDWRVVAYTAEFGPVMSFLYWNMNFHAEHHMYAAVPFYNLPRLHEELKWDFPRPIRGYWRGLTHVFAVRRRQKADPAYRYVPEFAPTAHQPRLA